LNRQRNKQAPTSIKTSLWSLHQVTPKNAP
jgi:hypothetical protein